MSEPINPTPFSFDSYYFSEFSFRKPIKADAQISLDFNPSGNYFPKEGIFEIKLGIVCNMAGEPSEFLKVIITANFKFKENTPYNEIPKYFYVNSIAIVFPYIRSFISTMTVQANSGLILLPIFNLTYLEKTLFENSKEALDAPFPDTPPDDISS